MVSLINQQNTIISDLVMCDCVSVVRVNHGRGRHQSDLMSPVTHVVTVKKTHTAADRTRRFSVTWTTSIDIEKPRRR